jgi:hypothetical protein
MANGADSTISRSTITSLLERERERFAAEHPKSRQAQAFR